MTENLTHGNILFVPIVHQRATFAALVRLMAFELQPDAIAVELPATLEHWVIRGAMRLPRLSAVAWEDAGREGELALLPIDPCDGLIEAVRLGCQHQIPLTFLDLDLPGLRERHQPVPDEIIADRAGLARYVEAFGPLLASSADDAAAQTRERAMAAGLRELSARHARVLCVLGLAHYEGVRRRLESGDAGAPAAPEDVVRERPEVKLLDLAADSVSEALVEIPHLAWLHEQEREEQMMTGEGRYDRLEALATLLREASEEYGERHHERINLTQWRGVFQFSRNLAMVQGRVTPDLYELMMAARGCVDGDYACELSQLAALYPPQQDPPEDGLPRLRLRRGRAFIDGEERKFRTRPLWEAPPSELVRLRLRRRPDRQMMEIWKRQWAQDPDHNGICSWPPEDELQENFMQFVRKRALQVLSEDRRRVEPFSTSLLDGLDIRETMRNWHTGRLYVQAEYPPQGEVGAVVIIFEEQPIEEGPSWRSTLYAENRNESDISFYATPLGEQVVGPRISRTEFGGLLSIFPAAQIPDIWMFPIGGAIESCSDALGLAAVLFSPARYLAWVAATPPRALIRRLAERHHKHIIYLPLHTFSRRHLRRVRRFHVLGGRDVRGWARDYIFED